MATRSSNPINIRVSKAKILEYRDISPNALKKGRNTFLAEQKSLTINGSASMERSESVCG
jgi:hypothetical protein